jgi:hypothetical protein
MYFFVRSVVSDVSTAKLIRFTADAVQIILDGAIIFAVYDEVISVPEVEGAFVFGSHS